MIMAVVMIVTRIITRGFDAPQRIDVHKLVKLVLLVPADGRVELSDERRAERGELDRINTTARGDVKLG